MASKKQEDFTAMAAFADAMQVPILDLSVAASLQNKFFTIAQLNAKIAAETISLSNDANNRLVTADGFGNLNGEANATFDGSSLIITGLIDIDDLRIDGNEMRRNTGTNNVVAIRGGTVGDGGRCTTYGSTQGTHPGAVGFGTNTSGATDLINVEDDGLIINDGVIFMKEQAAADADRAGHGQIWVKDDTPNLLFFTDDAGTDHEIAFV